MQINYYRKNVYGIVKFYFSDATFAQAFRELTGKKTFENSDRAALNRLFGGNLHFQEVLENLANYP